MISAGLQTAIDSLQIRDVYVRNMSAQCFESFDPQYADFTQLGLQVKHWVKQSAVLERENDGQLLRVYIEMGVRWVDAQGEGMPQAEISAEFVAEYDMIKPLEMSCVDEFAQKNASVHVWPYWRELLANQCNRMNFPRTVIPAMQLAHHRHDAGKEQI